MRQTKKEIIEGVKNIETATKVANNTVKCKLTTGENIVILHNTIVVSEKNGVYTLNSGGWRTNTTKDRINQYSPARVYQRNSLWYIGDSLFYDGIKINNKNEVVSKVVTPEKVEKKTNKIKLKIKKFCDLITKDNLPIPNGGDCWYCYMRTKSGESMGDAFKDHSHLLNHITDSYVHGSLLVNAMREAGYRDEQIGFHYSLKYHDTFKRATRKYLQKRLLSYNG